VKQGTEERLGLTEL